MDDNAVSKASSEREPVIERKKPGRKSRVSLSIANVIEGGFDRRPQPPDNLTSEQRQFWEKTVASEPPDFFASHATQQLLMMLCYHHDEVERINKDLKKYRRELMKSGDYPKYVRVRGEEIRRFVSVATKLRLTNQSRYGSRTAASAQQNAAKYRPWEDDES